MKIYRLHTYIGSSVGSIKSIRYTVTHTSQYNAIHTTTYFYNLSPAKSQRRVVAYCLLFTRHYIAKVGWPPFFRFIFLLFEFGTRLYFFLFFEHRFWWLATTGRLAVGHARAGRRTSSQCAGKGTDFRQLYWPNFGVMNYFENGNALVRFVIIRSRCSGLATAVGWRFVIRVLVTLIEGSLIFCYVSRTIWKLSYVIKILFNLKNCVLFE